jgi:hypothetical protein
MFAGDYSKFCESRLNLVKKYVPEDYFKGKTLIEFGCGFGDNGTLFANMGCDVTSTDARGEHLQIVRQRHPDRKVAIFDVDNYRLDAKFDIALHWGVLYHMTNIVNHIVNVGEKCNLLILETEVSDTDDDMFFQTTQEHGYDQAFNVRGIRPSPTYVDKILERAGYQYKMINDPIGNYITHIYDWDVTNSKEWCHGLRRFWIAWKNIDCPLRDI